MSFDLYFLPRPDDGDWDAAMAALGTNATQQREATATDRELWARVATRVRTVLPDIETSEGGRFHELDDDDTAIQVFLSPGEIVLTVPYWYEGDEADRIVGLLRRVADTIEAETGLTAYDPQDDQPFLTAQDEAARVFDEVAERLDHLGAGPAAPEAAPRPSWFRRLFGRGGQ